MKRDIIIIGIIGAVFTALPLFFERLHPDEVIYWEVARNIAEGSGLRSETQAGGPFLWHMPLAFIIVAPFLKINSHIFTARFVASVFTVASAMLIYLAAKKSSGRDEALAGALFFLFSFHALRFGARFYLDQFGLFFFLAALYLLLSERPFLAGIPALLSVLAREYWLGVYPFLFLSLYNRRKQAAAFAMPLVLSAGIFLLWVLLAGDPKTVISDLISRTAVIKNLEASLTDPGTLAASLRGWVEFALIDFLILAGFIIRIISDRGSRWSLWLVLPQVPVLSLIQGFVVNGAVTQYPMAVAGTMAVYSGAGLKIAYERLSKRFSFKAPSFITAVAFLAAVQYGGFNITATLVSLHNNPTIYALGFGDDREVISLLRREAPGDYIMGIHGAFVPDREGWGWTDFYIEEAIERDPDWLITFSNYVEIGPESEWKGRVVVRTIGPYVVLHALEPGALKDAVKEKDFPKWAFRKR